jgi:SAM-dependent methyltransferase
MRPAVMWHDVECGGYTADLPLWRDLAAAAPPGVLDVGAGTGRVALDLARAGHAVTALDIDPELLAVLAERARGEGLEIATVVADAAGFDLQERFGLIAVPMQTLQLLPDAATRGRFFTAARRALAPGGLVAAALATTLEGFDDPPLPVPDIAERDGWRFVSQPIAVREEPDAAWLERVRILIAPDGTRDSRPDTVRLARITPAGVAAEAAAHGLRAGEVRVVPETAEHVGSEVVLLYA